MLIAQFRDKLVSVFIRCKRSLIVKSKICLRIFILLMAVFFLSITALPSFADSLLYDDFDDGVLDSAWNVTYYNATGWNYEESGTELVVTNITPIDDYSWAGVILTQGIDPLADFIVDFKFSWDSEESLNAMQKISLSLYDSNNKKVASVGYYDAWVYSSGSKFASAGSSTAMSGYNTLPLNGFASTNIVRQDGNIDIIWDDISMLSGTSDMLLSSVALEFWYYPYSNGSTSTFSFFGTESVDLISDPPSSPVPEPSTIILLGISFLGIFASRKVYS